MKKLMACLLAAALTALLLTGCGNVKNVEKIVQASTLYSEQDIEQAMDTAIRYFKKEFDDCTLKKLEYAGDEQQAAFEEWARTYGKDEVIILLSEFEVGPSGGDGSLEPNFTYTRWQWILARDKGGSWKHMDHGYG